MKKSEIYYVAQLAVLEYTKMKPGEKLEALAFLSDKEGVERFCEEREAEKEAETNG